MATVRQLSEEYNVSLPVVRSAIKALHLQNKVQHDEKGKVVFTEEQEQQVRNFFEGKIFSTIRSE